MSGPLILLGALALDAILGEPTPIWSRIPHPAALMGRMIAALDRALNRGKMRRARGVVATLCVTGFWAGLGAGLAALPFGWMWELLGAAILLAQRSLVDHVRAVAQALGEGLAPGRAAVAMIVGRDPARLDDAGVARAAMESAAENFSDGVVAPAFWFLIGGLPGIAAYKALNTADSMIGHRNETYAEFGWAAARLDDLANWAPARLSAALLALAGWDRAIWRAARAEAGAHLSPNAGWPEAAMARALGLALGGPRAYGGAAVAGVWFNGAARKQAGPADIHAAIALLWRGWTWLLGGVALLSMS